MVKLARKNIADLGIDVVKAAKEALDSGADLIVENAKALCPEKTGALKASIHKVPQKNGEKIRIVADAKNKKGRPYGKYVEFWPGRKKPFLYPALKANYSKIKEDIIGAIREAIKKNGI